MNRPDTDRPEPPLRVLFVCSGNTCRSPMAEVLFKRAVSEAGLSSVEVRSAGTHTRPGMEASQGARRAAHRHGLTLEEHSSTVLTGELVEWADWIFAMAPGHLQRLQDLGAVGKALLLGVFGTEEGLDGNGVDGIGADRAEMDLGQLAVPDPFGGTDEVYEETFLTLERYVELAMKWLTGGVEG